MATYAGNIAAVGAVTGSNLSGTNSGDMTLAAVGSAPTAAGASLSGQVLTLQPADATHPGVVALGAQTLGSGTKTVDALISTGAVTAASLSLSGAITGATTGSFSGAVSAGSLSLSGAITGATTGAFSAGLTCTTLGMGGALTGATTGAFSGAVSAASLSLSGAVTGATTIAVSGRVTSSVATTGFAFSQLTGARFCTNGGTDTRYISDDGTNIAFTGPVTMSGALAITGALSGVTTVAASGKYTSSVASGSDAMLLVDGSKINFGTASGNLYRSAGGGMRTDASFRATAFIADTSINQWKGTSGITAHAGGGQGSATALAAEYNFVTTVASSGDSSLLPAPAITTSITVWNLGVAAMDVFPTSGGAINGLGTNVAYSLASGAVITFCGQSGTQWRTR